MISWRAKKQSITSSTSTKVEYRALAIITSELVWIQPLLHDCGITTSFPTPLICISSEFTLPPTFHEQTKHIEISCHLVHDKVIEGSIKLMLIRSEHQLLAVFTKPLPLSLLFPFYPRWLSKTYMFILRGPIIVSLT